MYRRLVLSLCVLATLSVHAQYTQTDRIVRDGLTGLNAVLGSIERQKMAKLESKTYTASGDDFTTTAKVMTIPGKCGMRVTFSPKADLSGVSDDEDFDMQYSVEVSIKAYNFEGTQVKAREAKDGCKKTGMYIKEMAADKADFNTFETKLYFNVTKDNIDLEK